MHDTDNRKICLVWNDGLISKLFTLGNPHHHRPAFSKGLGKRVTEAKQAVETVRDTLTVKNENLLSDESARKEIEEGVMEEWEKHRKVFVKDVVPRMTWNWNSARDKKGNRFKDVELLDTNAIARLNMCDVLKQARISGNFCKVDHIFNSIAETSCRHKMHTGPYKDGIPTVSAKDKCARMEKVIDKKKTREAREKQKQKKEIKVPAKKVKKTIPVCKRRYPHPIMKKRGIYRDPHKRSICVVSTASNDRFYNANSPDRVLFHIANCDDKVSVPGFFQKPPKVIWCIGGVQLTKPELEFFLEDEGSANYTVKYSLKGAKLV